MLQVFAEISVKFSNAYNVSMLLCYHTDDVTRSKYKPEFGIRKSLKKLVIPIIFSTFMVVNQLIVKLKDTIVMEITKDKLQKFSVLSMSFAKNMIKR